MDIKKMFIANFEFWGGDKQNEESVTVAMELEASKARKWT